MRSFLSSCRIRTVVLQVLGFAVAYALLALLAPSRASAQSLRISGDIDWTAKLTGRDVTTGGGGALRVGSQLDLAVATLIIEAGGSYHSFAGADDVGVARGIAGGELRIGKVIEPGVFAHVGVGHLSGADAFTAPTVDFGLALDLTLIPLIDLGVHGAYDTLFATDDHSGFSWLVVGVHAALVI